MPSTMKSEIAWAELFGRYVEALAAAWPWAVGLLFGVGLVVVAATRGWALRRPRGARTVLRVGLVLGAVAWAWHLRWVGDDAFISFRYAENLVRGHGLVFNPGERVEGYTNFLWTLLIAVAVWFGGSAPIASLVLSLASFAAAIVLTGRLVRRLAPKSGPVSIAAIAVAFNYTVASFATSGLETLFATTLALLMVELAASRRYAAAGFAGIAATMAHPDHAIFYAAAAFALFLERDRWRALFRFGIPFAAVYVPYFVWRTVYYGDLLPNTFYAKSGDLAYFSHGWVYLAVSAVGAGLVGVLPLTLVGIFRFRDELITRYVLFATTMYVAYVAKIGGDFMLGRLLVPILPFLFILAEAGCWSLWAGSRKAVRAVGVVGFLGLAFAAVPTAILRPLEMAWRIADERTFYPIASLRPFHVASGYQHWADLFRKHVIDRGVRPRVAISSVGILAWSTDLYMIDIYGLTDRRIARQPLAGRGRPGHEKVATPAYLFEREIDLSEVPPYPEPYVFATEFRTEQFRLFLPRYRRELLDPLRGQPTVTFPNFPTFLDAYDPDREGKKADSLFCDAWFFEQFYFHTNPDEQRRAFVRQQMARADPALAGLEPFLLSRTAPDGFERVARLGFDPEETWTRRGTSFDGTTSEADRARVGNAEGPFATSYSREWRDDATGSLVSEPFRIEGDVMTLRVGGGRDLEWLRVALVVDKGRPRTATGCESALLGRRAWNVAAFRGKLAQIEIADLRKGNWGSLYVDEIEQWRRR